MIIVTPSRVRSILSDCRTEADVAETLRYHKVKFKYSTDLGFMSIVVPCSSGSIRVYRTGSKSAPIALMRVQPAPYERPHHIERG